MNVKTSEAVEFAAPQKAEVLKIIVCLLGKPKPKYLKGRQ